MDKEIVYNAMTEPLPEYMFRQDNHQMDNTALAYIDDIFNYCDRNGYNLLGFTAKPPWFSGGCIAIMFEDIENFYETFWYHVQPFHWVEIMTRFFDMTRDEAKKEFEKVFNREYTFS